jgi:hypothetical protein
MEATIKTLIEKAFDKLKFKHSSLPIHAIPKPKYSDKTSNGLTKCIIDWINLSGGMAERRSNTGRYLQPKTYTNIFGKEQQLQEGKYIKSSGRIGTSDISGIFSGVALSIEVKVGKDKMSQAQIKYKSDFEKAGGWHCVAESFNQFYHEFKKRFEL